VTESLSRNDHRQRHHQRGDGDEQHGSGIRHAGAVSRRDRTAPQTRRGLQDCKMKSPHAAVLGLHAGQVERIMRRRHAVGQTLPPVYPEKLGNIDQSRRNDLSPTGVIRSISTVSKARNLAGSTATCCARIHRRKSRCPQSIGSRKTRRQNRRGCCVMWHPRQGGRDWHSRCGGCGC
jgi:hypothetical protein